MNIEWKPLKIEDLKSGDYLEWESSSSISGKRHGEVVRNGFGWINVGTNHTPRNQEWLNNNAIKVRLTRKPSS